MFRHILLILSFLALSGCGSGSSTDTAVTDTFSDAEKTFVHELFLTEYLWYDQVATTIDYTSYETPQSFIDALKVTPPDLWSFYMSASEYEAYTNQQTSGFGFGYTAEFDIYLVRIGSPAYQKLFRGDRILKINGQTVTKTLIAQSAANLGTETVFTVQRDGDTLDVAITPDAYTFEVTDDKVIVQGDKHIGYLSYDSFTESSVEEIETAFTAFKRDGIDELVIDLRYNGGGSLAVTSILLDNITNAFPGQRQMLLDWNENYQQNNSSYYFEDTLTSDGNELSMKRVVFLVSKSTASASEALINALIPYLGNANIITVGDYTHGKPVGMRGRVYGESYYFLINFFVRNNTMDTTSFDGIAPTCVAQDDLNHQRGDPDEEMLASALYYLTYTVCP